MNDTYVLTKGMNFKTFLKYNCVIVFHSCYLFTKQMFSKLFGKMFSKMFSKLLIY